MNHISLNLRGQRPDVVDRRPDRNNIWHEFRDTDGVLVFVHGFSDSSRNCWFSDTSKSYWPDRVASTEEFAGFSIFLAGYETSKVLAGDYGIPDCADALRCSSRSIGSGLCSIIRGLPSSVTAWAASSRATCSTTTSTRSRTDRSGCS